MNEPCRWSAGLFTAVVEQSRLPVGAAVGIDRLTHGLGGPRAGGWQAVRAGPLMQMTGARSVVALYFGILWGLRVQAGRAYLSTLP